ncbi:MAG: hypothetical protein ACLSGI_09965 [Butyricicoccaceae bacterium]
MQDNPYNLISFQSEAYTDAASWTLTRHRTAFRVFGVEATGQAADH